MIARTALAAASALAWHAAIPTAAADEVSDFYKGRQINIIVGYGADGAYDAYTRALTMHMSRFIPGNPALIGPPDMSPAIVAALRKAMMDTMADAEFRANAARMNVDVIPMSGEATAKRVIEFQRTPPAIVAKTKAFMSP